MEQTEKVFKMMEIVNNDEYIWAEKYRPSCINDLILPKKEIEKIKNWIQDKRIPNIMLTSQSPGTGKTSLAHILVNALEADVLWLNASKESGIDVVRNKIDEHSSYKMIGPKIVVLDEVDGLSTKAQEAVRGVIEEYTNVSYILTANYKHKIHSAIRSRTIQFDLDDIFKSNVKELGNELVSRFEFILSNELIEYNVKDIQKLIAVNYPSVRDMVQDLQKYSFNNQLSVDVRMLNEKSNMQELLVHIKSKNFEQARNVVSSMVNPIAIYDYIYNNIDNLVEEKSIPVLIVKTHQYMTNSTRNPVISVSAYLADIMLMDKNIVFKH